MYNAHKELNKFYEDHVRLKDEREVLASHRNTNIERLEAGLKELGCPHSFESKDQGSYAMHTINKHPEKNYDIDVAIIFEKDNLPSNPADARKRIEAAMIKGGGNFKKPPKAKTNCVRVSYAEGHHVDLAIYRITADVVGSLIIEHAGLEWTTRDPVGITTWFNDLVGSKSPSKAYGAKVEDGQLRRAVRWLKMFAKSRPSWEGKMPGGLIISALAGECYIANQYRDDSSLYDTMVSIRDRLRADKEVKNPVEPTQSLTCRDKDKTRIANLEENLECAVEDLRVLFDIGCTRIKAMQAWNNVFNHAFWDEESQDSSSEEPSKKDGPIIIKTMPGPWMKK